MSDRPLSKVNKLPTVALWAILLYVPVALKREIKNSDHVQ